jgi:hypothetical protein
MDRLDHYREIIKQVINEYASYKPSHGEIDCEVVIDAQGNHYELMHVGWQGKRRIHGTVIHIDLIGDKVWIQHDGTSTGVAKDLLDAGIPQSDIVLGFHSPRVRKHTEFAVA